MATAVPAGAGVGAAGDGAGVWTPQAATNAIQALDPSRRNAERRLTTAYVRAKCIDWDPPHPSFQVGAPDATTYAHTMYTQHRR